ncbi:hypothetical protein ACE6H2_024349 [Prunus campanulata]
MSSMSGMSKFKRRRSVNCYFGLRAKRFTCWTDANPGRRFDVCRKVSCNFGKPFLYFSLIILMFNNMYCPCLQKNDRCRFWEWFDEEDNPRKQKLIVGLLRRIQKTENEIVAFRARERKLWVFLVVS